MRLLGLMDLSIIIVNYNVKEFLQNLIHSICKSAANLSYEIIIIDNASGDGSVEFLKEKFPDIKLIANEKNIGFSKANNQGLSAAKGDYLLILNPDTIVSEDTFENMMKFFRENPDAGIAGCKILNPDGTLQLACRRSFPGPWTSFCKVTGLSSLFPQSRLFARYNLTYLDEDKTYEVDAISGSFMMMKREVYERAGGFDEQFFMYGEDLDLCYRIQKAGYKVYYVSSTKIIHYKGESTKRSSIDETKFFYNAMHLFVKKHLSTSLLVEIILRSAIAARKFFAFLGRRKLIILAVLLDFIFFDLCLLAAEKFYGSVSSWLGFHNYHIIPLFTIPALIHITVSFLTGTYRRDSLSVLKTIAAVFISFFVISSFTFFFKQYAYSRAVVIITYFLLFFVLPSWRIVIKLIFKLGIVKDEFKNKRMLIIGTHESVLSVASKLRDKKTDLNTIVGLIGLTQKEVGRNINGFDVVGSVENIKKVIKEFSVTDIIFSTKELSYNQMMEIVAKCDNENVEFKLVGNDMDFLVGKTSVSLIDDMPLIDISYNISNPVLKLIKTVFDYTLAFLVLLFVYPFIYFTSRIIRNERKTEFKEFILSVPKVLSSKMSFVGPKDPDQNSTLYLGKKGLTGLWYIDGSEQKEKLDTFYAKNQNIWLDLEIIGKTLNKMWGTRS